MKIKPRLKEDLKRFLLRRQKEESETVKILSAEKLSDEELMIIYELFPALKEKSVINEVDEGILAGVIIQYGSKVIDLSLRARLKNYEKIIHEIT